MPDETDRTPAAIECDDCGNPAAVVAADVVTRGVDVLCWPCLMKRALQVAQAVASGEAEQMADA